MSNATSVDTSTRKCRICGCTDENACLDGGTGPACHWVEEDLCSACLTVDEAVQMEIDAALFRAFAEAREEWALRHPGEPAPAEEDLARDAWWLSAGFNLAVQWCGAKDALLAAMHAQAAEEMPAGRILLPGQDY